MDINETKRINFRVRFSELRESNHIGIGQILHYIEDCNLFEEEENDTGLNYLADHNIAWYVSSWQIYVERYPEFNESLSVHTWDYKIDKCQAYRNGEILDQQGNRIVLASCPCVFMDVLKKRPRKIQPDIIKPLFFGSPLDMNYESRKIAIPDTFTELEPFEVKKADIDVYKHVNNARYVEFAEDYLPNDKIVRQVRVEYRKAATLHCYLYPKLSILDENLYNVQFCDETGKPYSVMEFLLD